MDAHELVFPDDLFDIVVGNGILHHLDLPVCLASIERVLKPKGFALFIEPLAGNPLLKLFRVLTPRARTIDEKPLTSKRSFGYRREVGRAKSVLRNAFGPNGRSYVAASSTLSG